MEYKIRKLRLKRGLTQEALSKKAGVSRPIIWKLEKGEPVTTTTETLLKLAKALECKVNDVFGQ